jgi:arylsulfatase A-like enzyme
VPPSAPRLAPERPIVILVTVDALRADVLADPAREEQLPNLSALRRAGVDFRQMRSTSPGTNASISSLFASKFFSQLHWSVKPKTVMKRECPHLDDSLRFPDVLASGGVTTVNLFTMPGFDDDFGLARGFDEEIRLGAGRQKASADEMAERAVARIRQAGQGPLFLWMHLPDAHAPYDLGGKKGSAFERYVREVALVDAALGKMRKAMDELGVADRTVWMISADHGEAFGEHGQRYHATTVYEELLRVPLIVVVPGVKPRVVTEPVSLLDIGPTVLDLLGHPTPGAMMGESLVPWLRGENPRLDRPIVAESSRGLQAMVFPDGIKIILDRYKGTVEVYDLARDPRELDNLADEGGTVVEQHIDVARAYFRVHEHRRPGYVTPSIR